MPKHALSFIELHNQMFMQGSNLGNKINAQQKGAKLYFDTDLGVVWIQFKGKVSFIPLSNVASADLIDASIAGLEPKPAAPLAPEPVLPPAIARGRGRPKKIDAEEVGIPTFDPNDESAAAAHREMVRAASRDAFRAQPQAVQNDHLIQEARMAAMGMKHPPTAQVQNAHQVGETAALAGKPKALSHAQLRAQVKAEEKTTL